jgi:FkbM family methyltransferase
MSLRSRITARLRPVARWLARVTGPDSGKREGDRARDNAPNDSANVETAVVAPVTEAVTASGLRIFVDPSDERGRSLAAAHGNFNPPTLRIWRNLLAEAAWTHVADIGANYGEMLVNGGWPSGATVLALEPSPRIRPFLARTLAAAGIAAEILPLALSETAGEAALLVDRKWSGTTRLAGPDDQPGEAHERIVVPVTTLAALLRDRGAPGEIRAAVKIDVEGYEIAVLKGLLPILDQLAGFAALVEILHVPAEDVAWLLDRFDVEVLDKDTGRLEAVCPATPARLAGMLAPDRFYQNDVVVRRRIALQHLV